MEFDMECRCSLAAPNEDGSLSEDGVSGAADEGGERSMDEETRRMGGEGPAPTAGRAPLICSGDSMAGQSDLSFGSDRPVCVGSRCARIAAASSICTCWCLLMLSCVGSFQWGECSQRCLTRQEGWRYSWVSVYIKGSGRLGRLLRCEQDRSGVAIQASWPQYGATGRMPLLAWVFADSDWLYHG